MKPVVLFYEFDEADAANGGTARLASAALEHGGTLRWAGVEQQVLIGPVVKFQRACSLHFANGTDALRFIDSSAHQSAVAGLQALCVTAVSEQPRALRFVSAALAWLLPKLPLKPKIEEGEEPYSGSSIMPTPAAMAELNGQLDRTATVVMINWLKFRKEAQHESGEERISGQRAYYRYGKVALFATHSLGAKLRHAGRYLQVLIGNDGDPALGRWDEFALMQYPDRKTFAHMATLAYYRKALRHRHAGLAEQGQALTISEPDAHSVWRAK